MGNGGENETVCPLAPFSFLRFAVPHGITPFCWVGLSERQPPLDRAEGMDYFLGMEESETFMSFETEAPSGQISVAEAATRLGLDAFTVYSFIQRDRLSPLLDDDGEYVVSEEEVAALAQSKKE